MAASGTIWVKTAKGKEEVESKAHGLAFKARHVLIMIDGKRDLEALQSILPPATVPGILDDLLNNGFIEVSDAVAAPVVETAAVEVNPEEDPFQLGQTFMINMAGRILGIAGEPISVKVRAAGNVTDLKELYPEWRSAIRQAPDGLARLKELEKKLFKVLGD
ncbi:MAG: hypothetical protein K9J74_10475 [Sulfuritalea sp.]|nr:hypothetical protein [Sulfuritalea sp.]